MAARGLVGAARESLGRAEALLEACPAWQELALVGRGYLDLACACAAEAEGDRADGALLRATVGARLATWRSPRSPEGRIAYRGLERLAGSRESVAAEGGGGRGTTLTLAPSATWFEVDDGVRVDLSRHSAPRRILDLLSSHQERERGQPLSIEALVGGAWPGERISGPVALNRLRVAISTLRSFGLRDLVVRHGPGYLLAPAVLVMRRAD